MNYYNALFVSLIVLCSNIAFCQTSPLEKRITISAKDEPIESILKKIEQLSTLNFSYKGDLFNNESKKTITSENKSIKEILAILISGNYKYFLHDNRIILKATNEFVFNATPSNNDNLVDSLPESPATSNCNTLIPESIIYPVSPIEIKQFTPICKIINERVNFKRPQEHPTSKVRRPKKAGLLIAPLLDIDEKQRVGIGMSKGMLFEFPILKKISLSSGILFHHQRIDQRKQSQIGLSSDSLLINYHANFFILEIPITVRYNLTQSKNAFYMAVSISSTYIRMLDHSLYNIDMEKKGELYKLGMLNVMGVSMGVERKIGNNYSIQLEPCLKFSLVRLGPQKIDFILAGIILRFNRIL